MDERHAETIAGELKIDAKQVRAVAALLADDATVPFICRYRKEATGGLDEVAVTEIRDRIAQLADLDKRRKAILKSLFDQGKLTNDLKEEVAAAETMTALEDVYLPYRPKRRTKATVAKQRGLEPLAALVFAQNDIEPGAEATRFVDAEKDVLTGEDALAGARDIIAEWISENRDARARIRELFKTKGVLRSKVVAGMEGKGVKYRDYFDWKESVATAPSHRVLAMRRGETEGALNLRMDAPEDEALAIIEGIFVKGRNAAGEQVRLAARDGYRRLLAPSMETEVRGALRKRADAEAIRIFADNLRQLLMEPPLGPKNVLAVDPGFRTGCKVVCLDRQGKLVHTDTIFPHGPEKKAEEAAAAIKDLCKRFEIEFIAVGNGTAGRETERFLRGIDLDGNVSVVMVDESGASVYSASKGARREFPDHDITVRGSVSIGRRLMDPLSELVKIEPRSIGVGQYQHDVDAKALKASLDDVVVSCVNRVGVDVNTAGRQLLTYVSGVGPRLAKEIVTHRETNGAFKSREDLKSVSRMGPKAFEQAAGFLRIPSGENPLDASAVHPESYSLVDAMARDLGCSVADMMRDQALRKRIDLDKYVTDTVGLPTLTDILDELGQPGRDPRDSFEPFRFADGVEKPEDLKPGMKLPGVVTNVTAFGAFVDIGVHQDGLVHVSQLADRFVGDPSRVVRLHQKVTVRVIEVDGERNRISLSLKADPAERKAKADGARRERTDRRPKTKSKGEPRRGDRKPPRRKAGKEQSRSERGREPRSRQTAANNPFVKFFQEWDGTKDLD